MNFVQKQVENLSQENQSFTQSVVEYSVVLLHPHYTYRSLLVAHLLDDTSQKNFVYNFSPHDTLLSAFLGRFIREMAQQTPLFGRYFNEQSMQKLEQGGTILEAVHSFAQELEALSDTPYVLLFEAFDYAEVSDDIYPFIVLLAYHIPPQCTIVINARTMPRMPWLALVASERATIFNPEYALVKENTPHDIQVFGLGDGKVSVDGVMIRRWEGHLPKLLLFYALDRPTVTRTEICNALWKNLETEQATNVFHVTKRRLHKALQRDVLIHQNHIYRPNPQLNIGYDVAEFVAYLIAGKDLSHPQAQHYNEQAIGLYGGDFLQGHEDAWILKSRYAFHQGYVSALNRLAQLLQQKQDYSQAIQYYQQALSQDVLRQDIHRHLLGCYIAYSRIDDAKNHCQYLRQLFQSNEWLIDLETQALMQDHSL